jgi:DNA (cytosine-5)-methyltransferase 1
MRELALFAGAGGGILGGKLLGWRTVCAVEWEPYPISVLVQRQNEGILPPFPIWDDVRTFDGTAWRGFVDVVSGGFPCQDISSAGKGAGINGERSSMWYHMLRIINEVQPRFCFIENSPHLRTKGLVTVLQGLAEAGYDAVWDVVSAEDCGASHERKRMWIVATNPNRKHDALRGNGQISPESIREQSPEFSRGLPGGRERYSEEAGGSSREDIPTTYRIRCRCWWEDRPPIHRMDDGVAFGMDRLKAIGNGQVPIVAATAWKQLIKAMYEGV